MKCPKCGCGLELKIVDETAAKATSKPSDNGVDTSELKDLLGRIADEELTGSTAEFVMTTRERFEKYGTRTRVSEKQMAWLKRIADGETGNEW